MLELAIMLEGQAGLNWPRWQRMALAVEDLGFAGLYRSDHFTISPPDEDSLDLWVSLTWLASHTTRITFGPLVSPVSFRDPVITARVAAQIDDLSGGRLTLGMGAGWQEREHDHFGYDLMPVSNRFKRFEEGLEIVTRLLHSDSPTSFTGDYYELRDAILLPRPQRTSGPPVLIGGNGPRFTLPLVARYATEWNAVHLSAAQFAERNGQLDVLLTAQNRRPGEVRRSMMNGLHFGRDDAELSHMPAPKNLALDELPGRGILAGTPNAVVEQLGQLAEAGVQQVMLQWLELDNIDKLEAFAHSVLPQIQ